MTGACFAMAVKYAADTGNLTAAYLPRDISLALLFTGIAVALIHGVMHATSMNKRFAWAGVALVLLVADLAIHNAGSRINSEDSAILPLFRPETSEQDPIKRFLSEREGVEGDGGYRVEIVYAGALWSNAPMIFGIESTQGYNPLRYALYDRAVGAQEIFVSPRPFTPMFPDYRAPFLDLLGVRYVASSTDVDANMPGLTDVSFNRSEQPGGVYFWENKEALPRVLSPSRIQLDANPDGAIVTGTLPVIDYRSSVILPRLPTSLAALSNGEISNFDFGDAPVDVRIDAYRTNQVILESESQRDAIIVLNDLYYPYWRVYVDGEKRELLRANYLFRGVHVEAGRHRVVFRFEPFSWDAVKETLSRLFGSV